MKSDFIDQAELNGTGISLNHGTIEREVTCRDATNFPTDGSDNSFRGHSSVRGACGGGVGNSTVAVNKNHQDLACGDSVYIVGVGVKTVTDYCPGCTSRQVDNYTTTPACYGVLDLGTFKTIKL